MWWEKRGKKAEEKAGGSAGVAWGLRTYLLLFQSQEVPGIWNMKIFISDISTLGNLAD